ncbi:MAG: nicotinamide riboside transporter PnuC [Candidatus Nanopelagicales bacterium]
MIELFTIFDYPVTLLELFATIAALIGVWLGTTGKRITWPWWTLGSLLYAALFWQYDLYASAALQFVFIAAAIWGWFGWGSEGAQPSRLRNLHRVGTLIILLVAVFALAPWLEGIGAAATWPDSFILVASVVAQVLMVREKFEAWPIWTLVNVVATVHYANQGLIFTAFLYAVFVAVALVGWKRWSERANSASLPKS